MAPKISISSNTPNIGDSCQIDNSVKFGKNVKVGRNTTIMAGVYLGDEVEIGSEC